MAHDATEIACGFAIGDADVGIDEAILNGVLHTGILATGIADEP